MWLLQTCKLFINPDLTSNKGICRNESKPKSIIYMRVTNHHFFFIWSDRFILSFCVNLTKIFLYFVLPFSYNTRFIHSCFLSIWFIFSYMHFDVGWPLVKDFSLITVNEIKSLCWSKTQSLNHRSRPGNTPRLLLPYS